MGVEIAQAKHVLMEKPPPQTIRNLQQGRFRATNSQSADDVQDPVAHGWSQLRQAATWRKKSPSRQCNAAIADLNGWLVEVNLRTID
jgi:hypothetical protein